MTSQQKLSCIHGAIDSDDAAAIAKTARPDAAPSGMRQLYYPYHWFLFRSVVGTILGESAARVSCLVDGRTGLFATTDAFDVVTRSVSSRDVLDTVLEETEAEEVARRYAPGAVRARRRSLVSARIDLLERSLVHKPFWVVQGEQAPLLVDGVTGALLPLST